MVEIIMEVVVLFGKIIWEIFDLIVVMFNILRFGN